MHTRKIGIMMPVAIVISMVFGVILAARGTLDFLGNVTEKVATSKSAGTIVNETSEVLGNATVETEKFFSPDKSQ